MRKKITISKIYYPVINGILLFCFIACSPRGEEIINERQEAVIKFNVTGIEDEAVERRAAALGVPETTRGIVFEENRVMPLGGYEVYTIAEFENSSGGAKASKNRSDTRAVVSPMENGIRYRLIIRDQNTNAIVKNIETFAGSQEEIKIDAGKKYNWYAFSVNNKNAVVDIDKNGFTTDKEIASKDILYAQGNVTVEYGNNSLNIVFVRKRVRMEVNLDVAALSGATITNATVELGVGTENQSDFSSSIIRTGALNVYTGAYGEVKVLNTAVNFNQMTGTGSVKKATFYTIAADRFSGIINPNTLRVRLSNLKISTEASVLPVKTIPVSNDFISVYDSYGSSYRITTNVLKSDAVEINGVKWAETNLTYSNGEYKFRANNDYVAGNVNDYWAVKFDVPGSISSFGDPCSKVKPEGRWRTPGIFHFGKLAEITSVEVVKAGLRGREWTATNGKKLYLGMHGYKENVLNASVTGVLSGGVLHGKYATDGAVGVHNPNGPDYERDFNLEFNARSGGWQSEFSTGYILRQGWGDRFRGLTVRCVRSQ
ncbi:hypothetical protein ATB99_10670 [Elizabethkingia meningoseptica]|uniref:hypothetical protein n=1 Tax=Elizabethkingia meningoseptica TaxID=238 RepID=UPI000332C847|nr:hypothetical protein [Elizabethkingia meningoseptica]AQX06828.1 hypothetical protein BBD33_16860 [Elizabethkingia meningoseptica]AQX48874.1 hypothetical protein B5G46_16845 [Elizabethkingia meningoseptica]EOR28940.1 hypothetical protein L100_13764 [Elizabethkingia meningoseptica ATCC 13253 = NBRC 12535]KUY14960.1 hypothetical protein ATB99_10670 [Elizabethkingia meningoseptica]MDE5488406.1 hypothetical protein [Elizabethkingia meningoseptica]